jgi:ferredoxin
VTYVITEPCIGEKNGACVDVCPAACIHTTSEAPQNFIDPDVCIECEQCVLVCPVHAVFLDVEVPAEWAPYIAINADFFRQNKPVQELGLAQATHMVEAIRAYAARMGLAVAAVVLNSAGEQIASVQANPAVATEADQKAYTALCYGVATHELRSDSKPLGLSPEAIDAKRVLLVGGGFPIVLGGETIGSIGVAGAPTAAEDMRCCQVALGH